MNTTFKKKSPPAGNSMRCEPGSIFSNSPSLYHSIVGVGTPSALQFNVAGSCLGTTISLGFSVIFGKSEPRII